MQEKKGLGRRWKIQSDTRPEGEGKGRCFKSFGESITIRYLVASPPKLQHIGTLVVFRIKRNRGSLSRNFKKKSLPLVVRMLHDRKSIIGLSMNIFRENLFRFDFGIKYSNILAAVDSLRFLRRFFFQNNHSSNLKISWCLMLRLKVY